MIAGSKTDISWLARSLVIAPVLLMLALLSSPSGITVTTATSAVGNIVVSNIFLAKIAISNSANYASHNWYDSTGIARITIVMSIVILGFLILGLVFTSTVFLAPFSVVSLVQWWRGFFSRIENLTQ